MPIDTQFPTWMLPKESPIDALIKGVQAGSMIARNMQQGQQLALQAQNQEQQMQLAQKKFALDAETVGLRNQAAGIELDQTRADLPLWQKFNQDLNSAATEGTDAVATLEIPQNFSPKSLAAAVHLKTTVMGQIAQTTEAKQYGDILKDYSKLDAEGKAAVNEAGGIPNSFREIKPELLDVIGFQQDRIDRQKQADLIAQKVAAPTVAGEYRLENTTLSNEGRIAVQELRDKATQTDANGNVQSSPLILPDGTVDPYHAIIRSGPGGRVNKIVSVKNKDEMNGLTPSQKVSVLKTLETANRLQSQNFFLSKEDRATHASNAVEWAKELESLLPGKGKAAATATPESKATMANRLAKEHPDWDRKKVIDEVNRQVP